MLQRDKSQKAWKGLADFVSSNFIGTHAQLTADSSIGQIELDGSMHEGLTYEIIHIDLVCDWNNIQYTVTDSIFPVCQSLYSARPSNVLLFIQQVAEVVTMLN